MAAPADIFGRIGLQLTLPSPIPAAASALVTAFAQLLLVGLYFDPLNFFM